MKQHDMQALYDAEKRRRLDAEAKLEQARLALEETREQLRESDQKFRSFLDTANDVVYILSPDGTFEFLSPKILDVLGYQQDELVGQHFASVIHPDDLPVCQAFFERVVANRQAEAGLEYRVRHTNGTWRWHDTNAAPLFDSAQNFRGMLGIGRDVQDRKMATDALQKALEHAEAASMARSRFIATMNHEIRTPLGGLLGIIDLMALDETDPEKVELLNYAKLAGRGLNRIVDDVLDVSKMEAGVLVFEQEAVDLRAVIDGVRILAASADNARGREITMEIGPTVPRYFLGDANRLRQLISNLVSNALRYSETGPIIIRADAHQHSKTCRLKVEVEDFGIGISAQDQPNLFRDFSQIDNPLTAAANGTGLGLAICKRIVEKLNGDIGVESQPGEGSTFWFELDVAATTERDVDAPQADPRPALGLDGRRILVAEDNVINQKLFMTFTRRMGLQSDLAETGRSAIEAFAPGKYDLILMDVSMPEMDGFEAISFLQSKFGKENLPPILALTAHTEDFIEKQAALLDVDRILPKPIDYDTLKRELEAALNLEHKPHSRCFDHQPPVLPSSDSSVAAVQTLEQVMAADIYQQLLPDFGMQGLLELARKFVTDANRRLCKIIEAEAEGDVAEIALQVHALKGAAMTVGFRDVENWVKDVEAGGLAPGGKSLSDTATVLQEKLTDLAAALHLRV
ncbi:PAS domain S-box-containing protein [Roseovarius litoreus]|uniref:histidine kinase n=1 Tax=Roseovarius litoreus TaxID=1155722 RepID=A0A1M7KXQ4_9RHOB|nr:ATP-binding protein [Roseovarius litoreus]SHM70326.1 PAS domain S-box-containing protein [Roseovarius litoreus]